MGLNVAQKLIHSHLVDGKMKTGEEIGLKVDQTLTQDATGTMVMLELEAMGLKRAQTQVSVQYVDHNLMQEDHKNADDHLFLLSACQKFGIWYSRPGNGVSHPVHQERFGIPGQLLLGSDSHTPAAGGIGMLAIGSGGIEVALAISGEPLYIKMPEIWGIHLTGKLPSWVSAKDLILELLRRHGVSGGMGRIIEYHGPGLAHLSAMDRHVIANMGTELGATSTVFPSDEEVLRFLHLQNRPSDWREIKADSDCQYDIEEEIDLSKLEPMIAMPSSPGNVRRVAEVTGEKIYQSYIGSSANPGYRDFAIAAEIVKGRKIPSRVSFDVNPTSRQLLELLIRDGHLLQLIRSGARVHQAGCNGCIGMGQAPATHELSLRTVPRNFPGRSGTKEDKVCLVSPETAAASAIFGVITDPRSLKIPYPKIVEPQQVDVNAELLLKPLSIEEAAQTNLQKGPNIAGLPTFDPLPDFLTMPVLLKLRDNISTDEIMPAGARVLPYRSNIPKIAEFAFEQCDPSYPKRARDISRKAGHCLVAGGNYGQGSSREHAALAPRFLGLRAVLALGFARIHEQNLVNFGVLPLRFKDRQDYEKVRSGDLIEIHDLHSLIMKSQEINALNRTQNSIYRLTYSLSERQKNIIMVGGIINWVKLRLSNSTLMKKNEYQNGRVEIPLMS